MSPGTGGKKTGGIKEIKQILVFIYIDFSERKIQIMSILIDQTGTWHFQEVLMKFPF